MKMRFFFTIILMSLTMSLAMASVEPDPKLIKHIQIQCDFFNSKIALDDRIDCVTDYVNCGVVGSGETDWKAMDAKCLNRAAKRRIHEQQLQN